MNYEVGTVGIYPIQDHGFRHHAELTCTEALKRIAAAAPLAVIGVCHARTAQELLMLSTEDCGKQVLNRMFVVVSVEAGIAYAVYFKNCNWSLLTRKV